jgi:hypothetical protein
LIHGWSGLLGVGRDGFDLEHVRLYDLEKS